MNQFIIRVFIGQEYTDYINGRWSKIIDDNKDKQVDCLAFITPYFAIKTLPNSDGFLFQEAMVADLVGGNDQYKEYGLCSLFNDKMYINWICLDKRYIRQEIRKHKESPNKKILFRKAS